MAATRLYEAPFASGQSFLFCLFLPFSPWPPSLSSSSFSFFASYAILDRSGKDPPRVALHESVVDKESVKLALRQHYPAGYRYLGCPVISSRVRSTVLLAARAPQRKLIALRATVPSSGTGPSTRSCPTAASPVLTRGYSPCDPIRGIPLGATTCRRSRALIASSVYSEKDRRLLLFHSLCSFDSHSLHTRTHTRARASMHSRIHIYIYIYTYIRSHARARERSVPPVPLAPIHPQRSLSLSLSRTLCPPSLLLPLPRFLVQPSFALFPPRRPDVSPSEQRSRHKGSFVGKRQAETSAHARVSLSSTLSTSPPLF